MNVEKRTTWAMVFVLLLCSKVVVAQQPESTCTVNLYDHLDYHGEIHLHWTSDVVTAFELKGADKWLVSPQVKLPSNVTEVRIDGSLTWKPFRSTQQSATINSRNRLVDFTTAIRPLRSNESWGKRMEQFVKELIKIEEKQEDRDESPSESISSNGRIPADAIKSAEQRLKFLLPHEHKQMLEDYGPWSYSESFCVTLDDINTADKQMASIWGSPASEFGSLSDKSKALYRASVMLFVEAGDGYGALIYHPGSFGGKFYWIHQDNLDEPTLLVTSQGSPRDYSSAMLWLIANQILFYYDDAFYDYTFVDRSGTAALPYQLRLHFPAKNQVEPKLEIEWNKFE